MYLFLQIKPDQGHIEKWVLRKAFDDEENPYLPKVNFSKSLFFPLIFLKQKQTQLLHILIIFFIFSSISSIDRRSSSVMGSVIVGLTDSRPMQLCM